MGKILFVKNKIGKSYLVWFQNSNLYFYFEEPAWFVFSKIVRWHKSETIAAEFSNRYGWQYEESLKFVLDIRQKVNELNQSVKRRKYVVKSADKISNHVYSPYSSRYYDMQNRVIKFSYETLWLEKYIHPLINHLETVDQFKDTVHFELFTYNNRVVFKVDNIFKGSWKKSESGYTKGRIFVELINVLHNKTDADWLMSVHASAVSDGRKTILFSASPGSGKTTFAALLQTHGYHVISDDFVPIEQSSFKAYPFPVAMSVKEGSMELLTSHYPELEEKTLTIINSKKKVKYLPVDTKMMKMIFPVNDFVFLKYDNSVDFSMEKIEPVDAIKILLQEAWIPPSPENVAVFLKKIVKVSFYNLKYSNNPKAIEAINQLFRNDKK